MATANMGLTLPVVSSTLGPQWATLLNAALDLVDSHNHTSGQGRQVPSAGINVDADLPFYNNSAVSLKSVSFSSNASFLATQRSVYAIGDDLWYTNGSGVAVQITNGSTIVGTAGSIIGLTGTASAAYSPGTKQFTWSASPSEAAFMRMGSVEIFSSFLFANPSITIRAPTSMPSSYTLTLPSQLPAVSTAQFLLMRPSGNVEIASGSGSTVTEVSPGVIGISPASAPVIDLYLNDKSVPLRKLADPVRYSFNFVTYSSYTTPGEFSILSRTASITSTTRLVKMGIMPIPVTTLNHAVNEQFYFAVSNTGAINFALVAIKATSPTSVVRYYPIRIYCDLNQSTTVAPFEFSDTFNQTGTWTFELVLKLPSVSPSMSAVISDINFYVFEE